MFSCGLRTLLLFVCFEEWSLAWAYLQPSSECKAAPDIIWTPDNNFFILNFYMCKTFKLARNTAMMKILVIHFCENKNNENMRQILKLMDTVLRLNTSSTCRATLLLQLKDSVHLSSDIFSLCQPTHQLQSFFNILILL